MTHTHVMCDDVSVNVCSVYFNIKNFFANMFCVGHIQSILHGDCINILYFILV